MSVRRVIRAKCSKQSIIIAREALHNAVKHAHAHRVEVQLQRNQNVMVLAMADDGVGFDPSGSFPGHLGLQSMRERAAHLGGTLEVESTPGRGTRVCATIPMKPSRTGRATYPH